ncbi:unnamed protein product [Linum tenue]|uniref:Cytochrome P450 n=1 Tax=Linum tenue TaxID=586396 RepID=A0AAV0JF39_9ROSI|nr:unnamed protein product [Linum tenue]
MIISEHLPEILVAFAVVVFFHLRRLANKRNQQQDTNIVPEIPGALPLVGHLHLLRGNQILARKLASFADKYGAVFTVRLGANNPTVVVSDYDDVKDCFTTHDRILAFRPDSSHAKILGYNYAGIGFAPYGTYLREIRKLLTTQLLSVHRIKALAHVQISEIHFLIADLYQQSTGGGGNDDKATNVVVIGEVVQSTVINIITRMIAGKRYGYYDKESSGQGRPIGQVLSDIVVLTGTLVPSDSIPILGWLGLFQGAVKDMKRVSKEMDAIMETWIDEHKDERKKKKNKVDANPDLIHMMLSEFKDQLFHGHQRENVIKATILSVVVAGTDTTWITVTWILSNLLNHKSVLRLAQEEIDNKVGKDRWADESDIQNLTYLRAVIKETMRMYPVGPLSVPRKASEDFVIGGSRRVPKGTWFMANFWKLHRDPRLWSDPDEYKPERFLNADANREVFGQQFEYLPFGSGRRGCPGINFGMQMTELVLARLLQGFDWTTPGDKPVDMSEVSGITLPKAIPLEVVLNPRLSPQLYTK